MFDCLMSNKWVFYEVSYVAEHVQYFLRTIGSGMFWHVLACSGDELFVASTVLYVCFVFRLDHCKITYKTHGEKPWKRIYEW